MNTPGLDPTYRSVCALLLLVAACAGTDVFRESVSQRAPIDLGCSAEQTTVHSLGDSRYGADGCGLKATYACVCTSSDAHSCAQPVCRREGDDKPKGPPTP
jgi:hypothetical protein